MSPTAAGSGPGRRSLAVPVALSLLLHVLLAYGVERGWLVFAATPPAPPAAPAERPPVRFEIVETPESAASERPPEPSALVSDRDTVSQDDAPPELPATGTPHSTEDGEARERRVMAASPAAGPPAAPPTPPPMPSQPPSPATAEASDEPRPRADELPVPAEPEGDVRVAREVPEEPVDAARPTAPPVQGSQAPAAAAPRAAETAVAGRLTSAEAVAEELARAEREGEFSYAATQHFFAEYLLRLREKVEQVWMLQLLSQFSGRGASSAVVEFTVQPDGSIGDLRLAEYSGESFFPTVCIQSIRKGAPFGPVPYERVPGLPETLTETPLRIRFTFELN